MAAPRRVWSGSRSCCACSWAARRACWRGTPTKSAKRSTVEYQSDYDHMAGIVLTARHRWQELWKYRDDEIRQAKAELDDSMAQRDQLYQDWKRNYSLRNGNVVAAKEYEQAESAYK